MLLIPSLGRPPVEAGPFPETVMDCTVQVDEKERKAFEKDTGGLGGVSTGNQSQVLDKNSKLKQQEKLYSI